MNLWKPDLYRVVLSLLLLSLVSAGMLIPSNSILAEEEDYQPRIAKASNEAQVALSGFRLPEGMKGELVAAEPLLANPVAFCIDEQGRFYICETFRQQKGVEDNRNHGNWLHADLAAQTVEDRAEMFKEYLPDQGKSYTVEHDRIRLLIDTNGDNQVDEATVFADGFNDLLTGTGAGVLAVNGKVYYTCIPDLWLLEDTDNDLRADQKTSLHYGYGVRVAFRGHDMHGLVRGPDGKIYYSIGDRGYNVTTQEGKQLARPETGAVFRCNLDGSELEVFAFGLRNPQELAFDDYGNLFTGDNNSDSGDRARWVDVIEGADIGWRMYYQYLDDRGPWNREKLWHLQHEGQAAYHLPPVAHLGDGPSGLVHYPGIGLPARYQDHFFLADFRGTPNQSGIRSFAVKPKGASYELIDQHEFLWQILATDVDFGYDGALYITDWVNGWDGEGKGRLYRFSDPAQSETIDKARSEEWIAKLDAELSPQALQELLKHPDQRIRLKAQFALADRKAVKELTLATQRQDNVITQLHGIWGLGQIGQSEPTAFERVLPLLDDPSPEVRGQVAKVLGDGRYAPAFEGLVKLLRDPAPRVRMSAAISLGKLGNGEAIPPLLEMLSENQDSDPALRHGGVMGLTGSGSVEDLLEVANHPSRSARLGVLLALRRIESETVAVFLNDVDPELVLEAARAINDLPIDAATEALASQSERPTTNPHLLRRILNANYRLGTPDNARAVANIAGNAQLPPEVRLEALEELRTWENPTQLDRVTGAWRPLEKRQVPELAGIVREALPGMLNGPTSIREAAIKLAAAYGVQEVGPFLYETLTSKESSPPLRMAALSSLKTLNSPRLNDAIAIALQDEAPEVRAIARDVLAQVNPNRALPLLKTALAQGEIVERQSAVRTLAELKSPDADDVLLAWMDPLIARKVPMAIQLDLLTVAKERKLPKFDEKLEAFEATRPGVEEDPLADYRECLEGGNAEQGRNIFLNRTEVSCLRCHKVHGNGGEVGPDLSDIGLKQNREYLLESIVHPNEKIAKGFESVVVATIEGKIHTGIVKKEDETELHLMTAEGKLIIINKDDIDDQAKGKSAMPADLLKNLTKADVRNLVEFLSSLKEPPPKEDPSQHKN